MTELRHFLPYEFACQCGACNRGYEEMQDSFLVMLDAARDLAAVPFHLTSAYRCPAHNEAVGGVDGSAHTRGYAVDVRARDSVTRYQVVRGAIQAGFNRIGVAREFVHLDTDPTKASQVVWLYD